ncbi:MAG TPA: DNA polymerase [Candidatus Acidoferrum sp.]
MNIVTLDFETYFTDDYTLSKMSTEEYVRDPRFEPHGVAIRYGNQTKWFRHLPVSHIPWEDTAVLCHHAHFDGLILTHHYGVRPKLWLDTLSMGRAVLGTHLGMSLESLARHFHLEAKHVPYHKFKNKHWDELAPFTQREVADGCVHDVNLTWSIFNYLAAFFPKPELLLVDRTIRMFTEGELLGDTQLFDKIALRENARKRELREKLGISESELQSARKFTSLLEALGIEIDYKMMKSGPVPAIAKNDAFMKGLLEDEDERVRALAESRLGAKSTGVETRARRLGDMSRRGSLCVYLSYFAAHTSRWGGGDKTNFQNLKRGHDIRKAIAAPAGKRLAIVDLSQIECRLLNLLAGQMDVVERFRKGEDPYVALASFIYGRPITKNDPTERGTGKQGELSCGYGCGWPKFKATAAAGTYGPPVQMSEADARRAVDAYRTTHPMVKQYWKEADTMLLRLSDKRYEGVRWGPMVVENQRIKLPNGLILHYETLEHGPDGFQMLTRRGEWTRMYGAKLVENVVQALARVIFTEALLRLPEYRLAMMSHDEAVFILDGVENVENDIAAISNAFRTPPKWLPDLPVECELTVDRIYSK